MGTQDETPPHGTGREKRRHPRYEIDLEMEASILIPEDTFMPMKFVGHCLEISRSGMKAIVEAIPLDLYDKLLAQNRYIKLKFESPVRGVDVKLIGQIMWFDYVQKRPSEDEGPVMMGIFFDQSKRESMKEFQEFVDTISATAKEV